MLSQNLFTLLDRSACSRYGSDPAVGCGEEEVSFAELRDRAVALAAGLVREGLQPGDEVAVLMGNRMEWVEVLFALARIGAVCVPVNVLLTAPEVAHVCRDSGARWMVVDRLASRVLESLDEVPEVVVVVDDALRPPAGARVVRYGELAEASGSLDLPGPSLADVMILYYSSGTTGLPKAATHTHNGVLWNSFGQVPDLRLDREVRYLVVPSLSWAAGFHNLVIALLWIGGYSHIMPTGGVTPERILGEVERSRITHVMLVPSLLRQFASDPDLLARLRDSTLRWVVTGSEPVPVVVLETLAREAPNCRVCQGYGLSEFPTIATLLTPEEALVRVGSAGRPLSHTTAMVKTDDGTLSPSGRGELLLRSPATMSGYHGRPDLSAEVFAEGWLHTGDLVEVDEDGFVSVIGRTKDMIISGGLNVYPKEVEEVLARLDDVQEVAVVGVPDDRFGEAPVAIVVPRPDATVDIDEAREACERRLASYKRPRAYLVRDEPLPRNATGKVLKRELRPWAIDRMPGV